MTELMAKVVCQCACMMGFVKGHPVSTARGSNTLAKHLVSALLRRKETF